MNTLFLEWMGRFQRKLLKHLPRHLQEGRAPYAVLFACLVIVVMLVFAWISPYHHGRIIPLVAAVTLAGQIVLVARGMSLNVGIHVGTLLAAVQLMYAAWVSGGIFSPRLAWMSVLPLTPYYVIGRRSGLVWLGLVFLLQTLLAVMTMQGWLWRDFEIGIEHTLSSFATYNFVTLVIIIVPAIYDRLHRRALAASRARQAELEKKRQELEHTLQLRDQFIATVSHELRTPMNAILGFNALLLKQVQDRPRARQILEHTRQSADHLLTVINDVLDYSQFKSGQLKANPENFLLRETVQNAFDLFAPRIRSMHLQYRCDIDPDLPQWVHSDRHRLMQILVNLLGNAIKFTHQGHVFLRVHNCETGVRFEVQDTGIGIPPEQQARIFDRFAQAGGDIRKHYGGNGLGLAITRHLVALLGGHMGFESQQGQGSRFWFELPLRAVLVHQETPTPRQTALQTSDQPWRFLLVDDHPVNRMLVNKVLQLAWPRAQLVEAENGAIALERLRSQDFDLVLMDMVMPVMDGIEATQHIRRDLDLAEAHLPVLGLTANVNPSDLERFKAAGLSDVMLKPFDSAQLCAQVERLLIEKKSSPDLGCPAGPAPA